MSLHLQNIDYLIEVFFKPFKVEAIKNFIKNVIISLFRVIINRLLILLHFNNLSILYNHDNKREYCLMRIFNSKTKINNKYLFF